MQCNSKKIIIRVKFLFGMRDTAFFNHSKVGGPNANVWLSLSSVIAYELNFHFCWISADRIVLHCVLHACEKTIQLNFNLRWLSNKSVFFVWRRVESGYAWTKLKWNSSVIFYYIFCMCLDKKALFVWFQSFVSTPTPPHYNFS